MKRLVPPDFVVPIRLETPDFVLRPLLITDVVKDYDAVMTSAAELRNIFARQTRWPEGLTFEDDLIDLGWHHKEFKVRRSFAYTVMAPDESICLGCVYINPTEVAGYDAEAFSWAAPATRSWTSACIRLSSPGCRPTGPSRPWPIRGGS